ncbi:hypothetical protein ILYODFUR_025913 [Ilyodon furcidens]|uniref:Uncharacterized protein n=1 Tax=Ilyodon furcidens TaxID=33524 RepID=A0ABV0U8I0_9TELE
MFRACLCYHLSSWNLQEGTNFSSGSPARKTPACPPSNFTYAVWKERNNNRLTTTSPVKLSLRGITHLALETHLPPNMARPAEPSPRGVEGPKWRKDIGRRMVDEYLIMKKDDKLSAMKENQGDGNRETNNKGTGNRHLNTIDTSWSKRKTGESNQ